MRVLFVIALMLCVFDTAVAETGIRYLDAQPQQGEGIYQLLRRCGLKANSRAYASFVSLNAAELDGSDALFPDRRYRLPVVVLTLDEPLASMCAKMGVGGWNREIRAFNEAFNDAFTTVGAGDDLVGCVVYIPELRSGYYETGSGIGPAPVRPRPTSVDAMAREHVGDVSVPYPAIKKAIEPGALGKELADYCFILDPGHGGNDPGTNPVVRQGDGIEVQTYEAPLVYDVVLRLLMFLRLHGGEVFLTHYSPEYGIRDVKNPQEYRHHRYNLASTAITTDTPAQSIGVRKRIVQSVLDRGYAKGRKLVFISVHADYRPDETIDLPIMVYYHRLANQDNGRSRQFALRLAESMTGSPENTREQGLGILYKNPADLEILVELVNLNNTNGAWRLRDHTYRETLARTVADGLVHSLE